MKVKIAIVCGVLFIGAPTIVTAADHPGADYALEYSAYELPATGVTRGKNIVRWGSESFVNDDGETMYRCKYVWADSLKQDTVSVKIEKKYPEEKADIIVSGLEK